MTIPDLGPLTDLPTVHVLGWTLVHFVWQGALVAGVLAAVLRLLRDHAPSLRYGISCVALSLLLVFPLGTGLLLSESTDGGSETVVTLARDGGADSAALLASSARQAVEAAPTAFWVGVVDWVEPLIPWIVGGWALGVLGFSLRLAGGAWRLRQLRRTSEPAPGQWSDRMQALSEQLGVRRAVRLRLSTRVESPMVVGWWRPLVLVPAGLLTGFPPEQVEALLRHELAHIRRHDVVVGRVQALVETVLFFHPATWWISKQVHHAREACCDDLAIQSGTDRTVYARALARLAERVVQGARPVGAVGASDAPLLERVRRVLVPADAPEKTARRISATVAVLLIGGLLFGLAACASQNTTTASGGDSPQAAPSADMGPASTEQSDRGEARTSRVPSETEDTTLVVVRRDTSDESVAIRIPQAAEDHTARARSMVITRPGEAPDTIRIRRPHLRVPPALFGREGMAPHAPDSVEIVIRRRALPDSLPRSLSARLLANRPPPPHPFVRPDTVEGPPRIWFHPDSMERRIRIDRDRLERRAHEIREHADSLERELRVRLRPKLERERRRLRTLSDSLGRDLEVRIDRDSVRQVLRLRADSMARLHKQHADSMRVHLRAMMQDRLEHDVPERLREEARRLRKRAEELEERARKMEAPPAHPEPPRSDPDTTQS